MKKKYGLMWNGEREKEKRGSCLGESVDVLAFQIHFVDDGPVPLAFKLSGHHLPSVLPVKIKI